MPFTRVLFITFSLIFSTASLASGGGSTAASPYMEFNPPFIVNVQDNGAVRHMQVRTQIKLSDPVLQPDIDHHRPALRHEMNMLLSSKSVSEVSSIQGKEALRAEALSVMQKVMQENIGQPAIEAIYFTEFIIQ